MTGIEALTTSMLELGAEYAHEFGLSEAETSACDGAISDVRAVVSAFSKVARRVRDDYPAEWARALELVEQIDGLGITAQQRELRQALDAADGNKTRAAKALGITRDALIYRMQAAGIWDEHKDERYQHKRYPRRVA